MSQAKFERYEAYKDSGVEWIGEVPAHWDAQRINNIARQQKIRNTGMRENNLLSLSYGKLKRKNIETTFGLLPESFETYQIVNKGNIILRLTDLQNDWTSLRVGLATERGIITSAYLCLHFLKLVNPTFAYYLLHLYDLSKVFYWLGNGLRQTMRFEDIKVLPFVIPPVEEQQVIATYLDEKTAQIDRKIDLLSQKATQYGQLKQALINETVTRGLDKTVQMKDSGVEWIGEVPAHWEVRRVKELGNLVLGKMLDNNSGSDKLLKFYLKSKNIGWLTPDVNSIEEMFFSLYEISLYRVKYGDLLFSEGGEVGKTSYWSDEVDECYIQNSVHKFSANRHNNSRYFLYLSFACGHTGYYDSIVNFVSIKHLTKEKLSRVIWLSPPLQEQIAIAAYLDEKTAHIDRIIATINTQIDKLKELRKTLINDVVTGKIKVVSEGQAT